MLPAARPLDSLAPPHSGSSVEIEKSSGAIARSLLNDKMSVEHDLLDARQQRIISVDVAPAHLRHADSFIREEINHLAQAIRTRQKVRIKNCHQFPFGSLHRIFQRSCLKSRAIRAVNVMDVMPISLIFGDGGFGNLYRLIR